MSKFIEKTLAKLNKVEHMLKTRKAQALLKAKSPSISMKCEASPSAIVDHNASVDSV